MRLPFSTSIKQPLREDEQLFFIHVPKCAGTSFISLLDECFVNSEICPVHYDLKKFAAEITLEHLASYKFIRGHLPYDFVIPQLRRKPRIITFLRNPVNQFLSYFQMRQRIGDPLVGLQPLLNDLTLENLLQSPRLLHVFENNATRILAGYPEENLLEFSATTDVKLAKKRLAEFDFIGITEEFTKSLELFSYIFDFPMPEQDRELNVSPNREQRQEIPSFLLEKVAQVEYADMELYSYGKQLFEEKYEKMLTERRHGRSSVRFFTKTPLQSKIHFKFQRVNPGIGWQVGETHPVLGLVRWSGPSTTSRLFMPISKGRDVRIQFHVAAWISEKTLDSLSLSVNGNLVSLARRKSEQEYEGFIFEALVPSDVLAAKKGVSELCFNVCETHSPAELDASSQDQRKLGLCYTWLLIQQI